MAITLSHTARRRVTALLWLSGLALAIALTLGSPARQIRALAWAEPVIVTVPEDGTLLELAVSLHQPVSEGDSVARLNPDQLIARGAVLEAELESLHSKESSAEQGRSRRFALDRETAGLEVAKLKAAVEEGQAQVKALRERLAIDERLAAEGVAPNERAGDVRRELSVVETRVAADRERLRLAQRSVAQSGIRAEAADGPNRWQIVMAQRRLAEIEGRLERLVLRSTTAGQVTEVFRAAGEWLEAGDPVLRISPMAASEVRAWLDSGLASDLSIGAPVDLMSETGERLPGIVKSVGVERQEIPKVLWARADAPEWGYLARIDLDDGTLAPGAAVRVGLRTADRLASLN